MATIVLKLPKILVQIRMLTGKSSRKLSKDMVLKMSCGVYEKFKNFVLHMSNT